VKQREASVPKTLVRRRKAPIKGQGEKQPTVLAVEDSATQAEALLASPTAQGRG